MPSMMDNEPPTGDCRVLEDLAFIHEHLNCLRTMALTMNCPSCRELAFLIELAMTAAHEARAAGTESEPPPLHPAPRQVH
ncbi:hypothetical protein [Roseospirillum parvum]|uniref:Uncharacterized protein n=1 Tax=Roseospirillum parvum TaxID=83401 RepID=A0A1G7YBC1_9PROT|nr:hypothetical protein [Roseospirillum parvum]SDG93792.1 hypothetical protein SAMN05421742_103252 [Roseospirillum parvum]